MSTAALTNKNIKLDLCLRAKSFDKNLPNSTLPLKHVHQRLKSTSPSIFHSDYSKLHTFA